MTVELHFNRFGEWPAARRALPAARRAAREALRGRDGPGGNPVTDAADGGEVSFTCLPTGEITEMNRRYLDRDRPTDVIAFPLSAPGGPPVGDVYLCPEVAEESAEERGLPASEEVVRLVAHGALHVLGHDHPEEEGRASSEMYRLQERIVRRALEEADTEPAADEAGAADAGDVGADEGGGGEDGGP